MYEYHDIDDNKMRGTLRDWRKALRTPATYRVGNAVRIQPQFVLMIIMVGCLLLILFYYNLWTGPSEAAHPNKWYDSVRVYNKTYPLTVPLKADELVTFRIGLVADLDTNSKSLVSPQTFNSYLKKGFLSYHTGSQEVRVTWDNGPGTPLTSAYSHKGRGMELSELIVFDGRLLTFDDRSGIVYEVINNKVVPWVILVDGDGHSEKGFKSEWATVKDEILYVGSMGKEWTTSTGQYVSNDPMWMKAINIHGEVQHLSWINQYKAIRSAIGIKWPGYMIHESGVWSSVTEKWYFLPRRCSTEKYNETMDELKGCNVLITADSLFSDVRLVEVTKLQPKLGFSSFKFIPGTKDEVVVALKTSEFGGKTATYITAFTTDGKTLLKDTYVENSKYEGLEFI